MGLNSPTLHEELAENFKAEHHESRRRQLFLILIVLLLFIIFGAISLIGIILFLKH